MYYENILGTIGNTPLVKLNKVVEGISATVLAKVETVNPGNSIKDRMAVQMIEDAEKAGLLKPGGTIIEGTSGNTGMGLAIAALLKGYKCIFTTTDKQSREKVDMLRAVGAEVIVCPTAVDPEDPRSYYSVSKRLGQEIPNSFYANQYDNLSNRKAHYLTTGPEIWEQTEGKLTHLVVGVGTGGTISGVGKYLKEQNPNIKIWGIDTYGSTLKAYHETGKIDQNEIYPYITEGIGEDIIPLNIDFSVIDHFEKVTDKDGLVMTREIVKKEGILVGNSAGSAIAGLLQLKDQLKPDDLVVVIFHDHASRYMGKIFNDDWMRDRGFLETSLCLKDVVERKRDKSFMQTIEETAILADALKLMKEKNISQVPVVNSKNEITGSLTEKLLLNYLLENPAGRTSSVKEIMGLPFVTADINTPCSKIKDSINQLNSAIITTDLGGNMHIITQYDLIQAIS